ncbi:group 1 truncated hemoglobin [Herbaspirillum sp. meg3]|uniref:group I truncated hemoglobin n=1 Tax=Herbaspirillum sp. meg3 TaxID=2025949 RepID=UPI000B99545C|nr:group 1 truncated hemoglobin [Herbaspirillum sp. meg3]ASU39080.1 group 1 truncated hemoglobin [Herbaspirillum sp. meg3]
MKTLIKKAVWLAAAMVILMTALPVQAQKDDDSLYRDLGGLEVLTKVVDDTLALALADVRIKDTFKDTDMKRLAKLITEQFCELSGGPCKYSGDPMKEVHQGLALNNMQFNALVEDLQAAMDKANIPSRTQNKLLALLAPMQRTVVSK